MTDTDILDEITRVIERDGDICTDGQILKIIGRILRVEGKL